MCLRIELGRAKGHHLPYASAMPSSLSKTVHGRRAVAQPKSRAHASPRTSRVSGPAPSSSSSHEPVLKNHHFCQCNSRSCPSSFGWHRFWNSPLRCFPPQESKTNLHPEMYALNGEEAVCYCEDCRCQFSIHSGRSCSHFWVQCAQRRLERWNPNRGFTLKSSGKRFWRTRQLRVL